jgi:hypothetical protein
MSYHILHQFDEQWFADNGQHHDKERRQFLADRDLAKADSSKLVQCRPWTIVIASLVIAAMALYFALDARRNASELERRLAEIENTVKS